MFKHTHILVFWKEDYITLILFTNACFATFATLLLLTKKPKKIKILSFSLALAYFHIYLTVTLSRAS